MLYERLKNISIKTERDVENFGLKKNVKVKEPINQHFKFKGDPNNSKSYTLDRVTSKPKNLNKEETKNQWEKIRGGTHNETK